MTSEVKEVKQALVLGAVGGSGNIGEAVYNEFERYGLEVDSHSCKAEFGYCVPELDYEQYDILVVTLGKEGIAPFLECSEADIASTVQANLVLPLQALRTWVHSSRRGVIWARPQPYQLRAVLRGQGGPGARHTGPGVGADGAGLSVP